MEPLGDRDKPLELGGRRVLISTSQFYYDSLLLKFIYYTHLESAQPCQPGSGQSTPTVQIGLPRIFCRLARYNTVALIYMYRVFQFIYSASINSCSNCDTLVFCFIFAFRPLVLALAPGAGMRPFSICDSCDSTILVAHLT